MDPKKLEGAVGLALRARKCMQGADACTRGIRSGKARVVLLDPSASENTRKGFADQCAYYGCPLILLPESGWLERVTGTANRRVLAVSDPGLAAMILKEQKE